MIKHSNKALISSVIALVLCCAMLIGTTFAWFTDEAKTGINKIEAGTLDVVLEMKNSEGEWVNAEGSSLYFTNNKWEPGCTYSLPELRVRNNGNLALKYTVIVNGITDGSDAKLLEVISFTVNSTALETFMGHLGAGESLSFVIQGHMDERAGNEYQGLTLEGLGISVIAAQDTVEEDIFGSDYDQNAEKPVEDALHRDEADEEDVLTAGDVSVVLGEGVPAGNYALSVANQNATTDDAGNTTLSMDISLYKDGVKVQPDGTTLYTVVVELEKGLKVTSVLHKGVAIADFSYDPFSGLVTFTTSDFSPFAVVFHTPDVLELDSVELLQQAAALGGKYALGADLQLDSQVLVAEGAQLILDMNGKSLSIDGATAIRVEGGLVLQGEGSISSTTGYAIRVQKGSLLIDTNDISVTSNFGAVSMFNDANVVINGGNFFAEGINGKTSHCIYVSGRVSLTINGGTFDSGYSSEGIDTICGYGSTNDAGNKAVININGGVFYPSELNNSYYFISNYNGSYTQINLNGGVFHKYDPSKLGGVKLGDGRQVIDNGDGTWTIAFDGAVASNGEELAAALASGQNILLTDDISYTAGIILAQGVKLYGNGHSITYTGTEYTYQLVKMNTGAELKDLTLNNYRVRTEAETNGTVVLENVAIWMDNQLSGLDISRGAGTAKLINVTVKGITDAAHLDPNTQVQVDYTPYGDVLLGSKWALEATDCNFGSLHGWNTSNGSTVSLNNTTYTVFRMHYWSMRTLYINGVETPWSESGAIPVAHDVGGCWSVQPAFK